MSLHKHELIGLDVEVVVATDPTLRALSGRVVDETRNMLVIEVQGVEKMVSKKGSRFRFPTRGGVEVEGEDILYRPEDRIKKAR